MGQSTADAGRAETQNPLGGDARPVAQSEKCRRPSGPSGGGSPGHLHLSAVSNFRTTRDPVNDRALYQLRHVAESSYQRCR